MAAKGDQGTVRALNSRLILRLLREEGPVSRSDLAGRTGLSNGAVTRIVGELMDEGLLVEQSVGVSTGGRRPVLLDLDTSTWVVAGLKLMDDAILAVLVDLKGSVVADRRFALRSQTTNTVLERAATAVETLLYSADVPRERLAGIGLCMPGAVDWRSGICRLSPSFGWRGVRVADLLRERVGVPVSVDNNVNALAAAESLFGRGRRERDFAVITVGRGVGAGFVHNGVVYRGYSGGAGEFGHQVSELGGRRCECGKDGCLEAYIGDHGLLQRVRELGGRFRQLDLDGFLELARVGDRQAERLYADVVSRLGVAIANLVNLLSPRLVILGGEASLVSERLLSDLREPIDAHVFGGLSGSFALEIDDWRSDRTAWARGAASLAMEHVFDPLLRSPGVAIA
jgi:predicted NBD/HSP70 family sugar kinase